MPSGVKTVSGQAIRRAYVSRALALAYMAFAFGLVTIGSHEDYIDWYWYDSEQR